MYHLKECIELNDKHYNSRFILAFIHFQKKQYKEAEKHYKTICDSIDELYEQLNGSYPQHHNQSHMICDEKKNQHMIYYKNYADCLILLGEKQEAVSKYYKSMKLLKILKKKYSNNDRQKLYKQEAQKSVYVKCI